MEMLFELDTPERGECEEPDDVVIRDIQTQVVAGTWALARFDESAPICPRP